MNASLEFHDSYLHAIRRVGTTLVVVLQPAYVHRSEGQPGVEAGSGWHEVVHLEFAGGEAHGSFSELPAQLSTGSLSAPGKAPLSLVPLPFRQQGSVELSLTGHSGLAMSVFGHGVAALIAGGPGRFIERFPALGAGGAS